MSNLKKLYYDEQNYEGEKLILAQKSKISFIELPKIVLIERQLRKSLIITDDNQVYETYKSLKQLEQVLPSNHFVRTHKSFIVNKNRIEEVELYSNNVYIVKFTPISERAFITKDRIDFLLNIQEGKKEYA